MKISLMLKRNQVEEAIALVFEPGSAEPSSEMRTRLKRLLETDRALGRNKRSAEPKRANFAFYGNDAPGRGIENWFSEYEAFALLTGLRLMRHGWPQGRVVALLRRVRADLEKHHDRILKQDTAVLFDENLIRQRAKPGTISAENTDPTFLAINTSDREDLLGSHPALICRGQAQLMSTILAQGPGQTWTMFEFAKPVHELATALAKTSPRKRGRESH
jgi:hypothetical protein